MTEARRLPYPGLRSFTADEADLFFGREGCVDAMVDRLAASRFLTVLGPSGSGKSSLVRTGLIEALESGFYAKAGSRWRIADMHPGGQGVIRNLAAALLATRPGKTADAHEVELLVSFLRRGPRGIVEWARDGNLAPGWNLLILVDQFEELFRYLDYSRREEVEAFVGLLLEAAAEDAPIHVVLTMRAEYLGACTLVPGLAERVNRGMYLIPRMGREECREAIEGPAGVERFEVEPALVTRMLNDLARFAPFEGQDGSFAAALSRRADQLPLMQHVLNRLWQRAIASGAESPRLTLVDYEAAGGLTGSLNAHGEQIIAKLGANLLPQIETVFRALVSGETPATAVRRPARLHELKTLARGAPDDVRGIVAAFSAADCNFLMVSDVGLGETSIVEIGHESLIRQWTRLSGWLEKEANAIVTWRQLQSAARRRAEGRGELLAGLDLSVNRAWWDAEQPTAAWADWVTHGHGDYDLVDVFLRDSKAKEDADMAAFIERQDRIEAEQAAEAQRVANTWRRRLVLAAAFFGVALGVVAATITLVFAFPPLRAWVTQSLPVKAVGTKAVTLGALIKAAPIAARPGQISQLQLAGYGQDADAAAEPAGPTQLKTSATAAGATITFLWDRLPQAPGATANDQNQLLQSFGQMLQALAQHGQLSALPVDTGKVGDPASAGVVVTTFGDGLAVLGHGRGMVWKGGQVTVLAGWPYPKLPNAFTVDLMGGTLEATDPDQHSAVYQVSAPAPPPKPSK